MKKSRVIAIALLVAAVATIGLCWRPLMELALYKQIVLRYPDGAFELAKEGRWRWQSSWKCMTGPSWRRTANGDVFHTTWGPLGQSEIGNVTTRWNSKGTVTKQWMDSVWPIAGGGTRRGSIKKLEAPWWPHPPFIDLSEFEE